MRIVAAWIVAIVLLAGGIACIVEALTTTHSVWLSIPMLVFAGVLLGPAVIMLLALGGLFEFALELNGHRMEFRRRSKPEG